MSEPGKRANPLRLVEQMVEKPRISDNIVVNLSDGVSLSRDILLCEAINLLHLFDPFLVRIFYFMNQEHFSLINHALDLISHVNFLTEISFAPW